MSMKHLAVRVAVILTVVVALCMFFGQTVLTLTTPKVTFVSATTGKLEEKIPITAELYYDKPESYTLEAAKDQPVTVESVYVVPGDRVSKGDTLFTCRLSPKYDDALKTQRDALDKARAEQVAADMETSAAKLKKTGKNDAEDAYYAAAGKYYDCMMELAAMTGVLGIEIEGPVESWPNEIGDRMTTAVSLKFDELWTLKKEADAANKKLMNIHRRGKIEDDAYNAIKKRRDARKKVQEENDKLVKLIEAGESLKTARAPKDGVVLAIDVKEHQDYMGDKPAYQMSETQPMLRADVSEVRKQLAKDMRVDYKLEYETIKTKILDMKREVGGKKYAIIELTDELTSAAGGLRELGSVPIQMTVVYKAKSNTTLVPISAVQGSENDYYVLVAEEQYGMWGIQTVARKRSVRVIEQSDRLYSVEEDLGYQRIVTQPSAHVEDGTRVMQYE